MQSSHWQDPYWGSGPGIWSCVYFVICCLIQEKNKEKKEECHGEPRYL